jgi:hypothetical protein
MLGVPPSLAQMASRWSTSVILRCESRPEQPGLPRKAGDRTQARRADLAGATTPPKEYYLVASTMYLIRPWQMMPMVRRLERHFVRGRLQGSEYGRA